jgi:hypothetical protein
MSAIYEYLFSQDSLVIKYRGLNIVIVPGMACHVRSKRLQAWCLDGVVKSIYKSGLNVTYGHSHFFNSLTRGNSKFVSLEAITTDLRFPSPKMLKAVSREDLVDEGSCRSSSEEK